MAVEVEVTGTGVFAGARSNIGNYSVQEDSTPVVASDSSGGIGQITFTATDDPSRLGSLMLLGDTIELSDGDRGLVLGKVANLSGNNGVINVTADSRLAELLGERRVEWYDGTFSGAIAHYFAAAGITTGYTVDTALSSKPVVVTGFIGDLWTKLKELLVVNGAEIAVLRGQIVIRPIRGRKALEINNASEGWSLANAEMAETVEVAYYNTQKRTNTMVYPEYGWNSEVDILTVDAGETKVVNLPINAWLSSVTQPVVQDYVAPGATGSVYAVAGSDGLPITAAQWTGTGGSLRVAVGEDGMSIDVTLIGATGPTEKYAPYRIAVSAGSGNYYSSLRIHGTGVVFDRKVLTAFTGAGSEATSDNAPMVDNIFVRTYAQAQDIAAEVAVANIMPRLNINIGKTDINKPGSSDNNYDFATFGDNDAYLTGEGIEFFSDFDAAYPTQTFGDYDNFWYERAEDDFDLQTFGNAAGARIQWRRNFFRIRSVTTTESSVDYTAEVDTTFGDLDNLLGNMTFGDYDAQFTDITFTEHALAPLVNVKPEYDRS